FRVLGVPPARGREFQSNDELPGNNRIAIISDRVWRNQLASAPDIIGRKILLESAPYEVVGVMPPGVEHPGNAYNSVAQGESVDVWTPFSFQGTNRGSHYPEVIGRLKRGVSAQAAGDEVNAILHELSQT